ncbi:MAG: hypothetical protein ACXQTG_06890 [Methanoculleaceae archaeon]
MGYRQGLGALVIILVLFTAGCARLPDVPVPDTPGAITPGGGGTPTPTSTPVVVTPATPYPTETPIEPQSPTYRRPPEPEPPRNFTTVYVDTFKPNYTTFAWTYTLTEPPMIIELDIVPEYQSYIKTTTSQYGSKEEVTVTAEYVSPASWMKITIRNRATGDVVAQDGFNRVYSTNLHREVFVRQAGTLLIELTGNNVDITLKQKVPAPLVNVTTST